MALTKDDIDAVAINLLVDGIHTFQVYLTRGGLTHRMGWSDRTDPEPVLVRGATDCFEPFMAAVPEALLQGESASMEDEGRHGARHDWRFELGGGPSSVIYQISYHAASAGLPDEFADMVIQAERLTHAWYAAGVAEETGVQTAEPTLVASPAPRGAARSAAPSRKPGPASEAPAAIRPKPALVRGTRKGALVPASRERIAVAILLDFFALGIVYAYVAALFANEGADGPPGAGLVLFAIVEFVLLVVFRRSIGYWLLGLSAPPQGKPQLDSSWRLRESRLTIAVGVALCWTGASGMTSWLSGGQAPIPYFGLPLGSSASVIVTLLFAAGSIAAGVLVLRTDTRGVWIGGGVMGVMLLAILLGWSEWDNWVAAELQARAASGRRTLGVDGLAAAQRFVRVFLVAFPLLLSTGLALTWIRFVGPLSRGAPVPHATR